MRLLTTCCVALWLGCGLASAHPGGVDAKGCHVDSKTRDRHCHPERAHRAQAESSRPPRAGDEGVFHGPFIEVVDGDSLRAKIQGVVMDFRLAGIDAPEMDQPYGSNAKQELDILVRGKTLVIAVDDVDRYGRIVGDVWIGNTHVNLAMMERGAAWFYPQYARDERLFRVEEDARDAKRGLWALPAKDRVEPWEWRERQRATQPASR